MHASFAHTQATIPTCAEIKASRTTSQWLMDSTYYYVHEGKHLGAHCICAFTAKEVRSASPDISKKTA